MIFDTSVKSERIENQIDSLVGKPLTVWQRLKTGGNGSRRMTIYDCSHDIRKIIDGHSGINFSSIELRSKGIIIFLKKRLNTYSWPIPFYRLSIYKSDTFSLHGEGSYIKYKMDANFEANSKFIQKLYDSRLAALN